MKKLIFILILLIVTLAFAGELPPIRTLHLDNGLTAVLCPMPGNPTVALRYYVRAGSMFEGEQEGAGMSHVMEHLMGDGTKTHSAEQISATIRTLGGSYNAYTTYDHCAYHIETTPVHADQALEFLTQNVFETTAPPDQVEKERKIVVREINMNEDEPGSVLWNLLFSTAFIASPIRIPVIGYAPLVQKLDRDTLLSYYHRLYVPNNAVLAIAGGMSFDEMEALVHKYCDGLERGVLPQIALSAEPPQDTPRSRVKTGKYNLDYVYMGWHSTLLTNADTPTLDLTAAILGQGLTSRLYDELVTKRQLCLSVESFNYSPPWGEGFFGVAITTKPGESEPAIKAAREMIMGIITQPPTADELARSKRSMENAYIMSRDNSARVAGEIGTNMLNSGNPRYSDEYLRRLNLVSAGDISRVAKAYLRPEGLTTAMLTSQQTMEMLTAAMLPTIPVMTAQPNGAKVIHRFQPSTGLVSMVIATPTGGTGDPTGKEGISNFAWHMMLEGADGYNRDAIADFFDRSGGISLSVGDDYSTLSVTLRKEDLPKAVTILAAMLSSPTLPADSMESLRGRIIEGIKSVDDDWMGALMKRVRQDFFAGSSYAGLTSGTEESVSACTKADLLARLGEMCRPDGMVISIVGDIQQAEADKLAAEITKKIASRGKVVAVSPTMNYANKDFVETFPGTQSVLAWAFPTFPITGKDRFTMEVLDTYLSGYGLPSGPLHDRLRNEGLVYVTHAYNWNRPTGGMFFIYAATAPGMEERTKQIVTEEIANLKTKPITEEQLKTAQDMCVTGRSLYEMQRPIDLAQTMAYSEIFGLGYDEFDSHDKNIRAVTIAEVQQAAEKYFGQGFTLYMHGEDKAEQPK